MAETEEMEQREETQKEGGSRGEISARTRTPMPLRKDESVLSTSQLARRPSRNSFRFVAASYANVKEDMFRYTSPLITSEITVTMPTVLKILDGNEQLHIPVFPISMPTNWI